MAHLHTQAFNIKVFVFVGSGDDSASREEMILLFGDKVVLARERKRVSMLIDDCCRQSDLACCNQVERTWRNAPDLFSRNFSSFNVCEANVASGDKKFSSKGMVRTKSLWSIETLHLMPFLLSVLKMMLPNKSWIWMLAQQHKPESIHTSRR